MLRTASSGLEKSLGFSSWIMRVDNAIEETLRRVSEIQLPGSHFDLVDLPHITPQSPLPAGGYDDGEDSEDGW
jgi:hypothetical protein